MKNSWAIAIAGCMVVITITIFCLGIFSIGSSNYSNVKEGVIDLTAQNDTEILELNGQWEFYADKLLTPSEINETGVTPKYIRVPGSWYNHVNSENEVEVGTYRVVVKVPKDEMYGIRINSIRHASKVFMNGIEVGGMGNPTTKRSDYTYMEKKYNAYGKSSNGEIEIVIQVAHRFKANGGIVKPIVFGSAGNISYFTARAIILDCIIIAGHLLMGLIFLLINIIRKRFASDLYFAFYCLAQGILVATQNEKLVLFYLPEMNSRTLLDWQYGSLYLTVLFLILFFYQIYKNVINKYVMTVVMGILCIVGILQSTENPIIEGLYYKLPPVALQMIPIVSIGTGLLYTLVLMIKAMKQEKKDANSLLITVVAFICYMASLGLELLFEVHMGYWPILVQVFMMVSIAYFIGYRNEKANRTVEELTQELYVQNELKDELILKISQEMNKPLSNLFHASKILLDGKTGPLKTKQHEAVISINATVSQLERMISDFLEASQSKGQMQFTINPTSLNILKELIYEVSFFIKEPTKVKIKNNLPQELPIIMVDEKRLKQALFNVLHNAVKYTEEGEIVIDAFVKGTFLYMTVEDTGIGIDAQKLQNVFTTFYQVPNVRQNEKDGLGVGLSIARQYVRMMNGEITMQSQIGKGTIVTISLPIYEEYLGYKETMEQLATTSDVVLKDVFETEIEFPLYTKENREETILIINQDKNELLKMTKGLANNGYSIYAYNDSEDVISNILNKRIDIIIIDANMTKEFVLTLTREVRKLYQIPELPIILLSKTNRLEDVEMLFKNGINVILRKPIIQEEFISHIQSLLTMKEAVESSVKQELSYYYAQITPHFLYNTLNSIIGLSYTNVEKSREALEHLAIYFRAKLDYQKQQSIISIEEEMELVYAYLAIEQLRFKQLQVEFAIDERINIKIPAMTLQPLVENAIHHGLVNKEGDAKLRISIQQVDEFVQIVIEDNGVGISPEKQHQLLQGQSQRLGFLNPFNKIKLIQNSEFKLYSKEDEGTKIVIKLRNI